MGWLFALKGWIYYNNCMYSNEQSRINAVISYFFLGPFILFAKKDTPLGESYVQAHARESSKIIGVMALLVVWYFLIRDFINFGIPGLGISFSTLVIAGIVGASLFYLARWAYLAYLWNSPWEKYQWAMKQFSNIEVSWVYTVQSEEEKSRILASMIPFLGIWITKKYNLPVMVKGRVVGSLFAFLYILSLFFSSEVGFIPTIILILGIVLFVVEGIYLFLYNSFVSWNILDKIPTYLEIESHIKASIRSIIGFFQVSFGKEKTWSYREHYANYLQDSQKNDVHSEKYFMPAWLIGLPFWNVFALPSLFIKKYQSYHTTILEWLIITWLFCFFFFWRKEFSSPYLLLLLFPIVHILVFASQEKNIHTPWIGLITGLFRLAKGAHTTLKDSTTIAAEKFTYPQEGESEKQ